jgi:2-oxoglutarate decarboxylase
VLEGDEPKPIRGVGAVIVDNMEASLGVPTATSVRAVPAKLLEVNRQILNNHLARTRGGKVSFTHLIAYAVLKALGRAPAMNASFGIVDGKPTLVRHTHVNLGLAVDVQKADGSRSLVVPNIKLADTLDFAAFHAAYEEVIRRVRANKITADDFAGTTVTITNPGMIGTVHSVPRLMPGQGLIVGVGSIDFGAEYQGADPATIARLGVSKTTTLTSTYDHRIIGGAESGEFLRYVHEYLLGGDDFYDEIFHSCEVPYVPARWIKDLAPTEDGANAYEKVVHVFQLINMYRVRGHLIANLDPLRQTEPHTHPELDPNHYGLTIWDLEREYPTGGLAGSQTMTLRDILGVLRNAYARTIGVEYMHMQEPDQKAWIQERFEGTHAEIDATEHRRILERLNAAEVFERFLHTKYLGHKRFSLEGAESLIPMLDALLSTAADESIEDVVLGMAHRGRLNVLANVLHKSYELIFREFDGELDPSTTQGSGDVKYHLGATAKHESANGHSVGLTLSSNPSHLETVDPVVEGMARAMQDIRGDKIGNRVLPVLVHGDAAFAGQGVVAETFNLSQVPGFDVGGTVHIVVNNQVGFTTDAQMGRSSVYATDVAKMVQAPIFHVNGDDPEACVRVVRLAFEFRQTFNKDVVVDMICYRRYGHNEGDEPAYTQPLMYAAIDQHRSVRKLYTEALVNRGDLSLEEAEAALDDFRAKLQAAFEETRASKPADPPVRQPIANPTADNEVDTRVDELTLDRIVHALTTWPDDFAVHPKLQRLLGAHRTQFEGRTIDWSLGEALAYGSLLLEEIPVRLSGQDTRRGTFSHRHAVLVDVNTEAEYTPLNHIAPEQAEFRVYDSVLSEYAALGFDYGYSVVQTDGLVLWEAQFGDFVNGAQIVLDQFVVAAEAKWGQRSSIGLLLPHGYEGQGPDHSSARLERFLTLSADDNIRVVYPSTAAQFFHVLRRQAHHPVRRPLVCLTPKKYLRMPASRSSLDELTTGHFQTVLADPNPPSAPSVQRVILATGKVAHELIAQRDQTQARAAIVRVEQLYPYPEADILAAISAYPNATEVVWVQEEPANMGAWGFMHGRLHKVLRDRVTLRHIARPPSAAPASGSQKVHEREQAELLASAFADLV